MEAIVKSFHCLMDKLENELNQSNFTEVNKLFDKIKKVENNLIAHLSIQDETRKFFLQLHNPFLEENKVCAMGFDYKAKKFKDGVIKIQGQMPSKTTLKRNARLFELEVQRLKERFKQEIGLKCFVNQAWEERFFKELENATNRHERMQYERAGIKSFSPIAPAGDERLYYDNSISLSDTITQAKQKLLQTKEKPLKIGLK